MARGDSAAALKSTRHRLQGRLEIGGQDQFLTWRPGRDVGAVEDRDVQIFSSTHIRRNFSIWWLICWPAQQCGDGRGCGMGRRLWRQGNQPALPAAVHRLAASKLRRPVKFLPWTATMILLLTGKRHDFVIDYDCGSTIDGRIEAVRIRPGLALRLFHDLSAGGSTTGHVPFRQLLFSCPMSASCPSLPHQHPIEHRFFAVSAGRRA